MLPLRDYRRMKVKLRVSGRGLSVVKGEQRLKINGNGEM
jgi:hypothetical protein